MHHAYVYVSYIWRRLFRQWEEDEGRLIVGSIKRIEIVNDEGALGVVTEVVLRVQRLPASRAAAVFDFGDGFMRAAEAARAVVQAGGKA